MPNERWGVTLLAAKKHLARLRTHRHSRRRSTMGNSAPSQTAAEKATDAAVVHHHADFLASLRLTFGEGVRLIACFRALLRRGGFNAAALLAAPRVAAMSAGEFCRCFRLESTPFSRRAFRTCFPSAVVDYASFVRFGVRCCATDQNGCTAFAFGLYAGRVYAALGADHIGLDDFLLVARETYDVDNTALRSQVGQIRNTTAFRLKGLERSFRIHADEAGRMTPARFAQFVKKNTLFLFPAFKLQQQVAETLLGQSFWEAVRLRREQYSNVVVVEPPVVDAVAVAVELPGSAGACCSAAAGASADRSSSAPLVVGTCSADASEGWTLAAGTRVEAMAHGFMAHYPGAIEAMAADGTYSVKYDDGDHRIGIPMSSIIVTGERPSDERGGGKDVEAVQYNPAAHSGKWCCAACTLENGEASAACDACGGPRPPSGQQPQQQEGARGVLPDSDATRDWNIA